MILNKIYNTKGKIIQMENLKIEEMIIKEMIIEISNKILIILKNIQIKVKDKKK